MPVRALEVRVYVHATEDREKVLQALREVIPREAWEEAVITEEVLHGHYGNPITVVRVRIEKPETAEEALNHILSRLTPGDKKILASSLEDRVDKEGTLYFRLSKQDAYLGRLIVYEADDVIRISVSFTGKRKDAIKEYDRILGE